MDNNGVYKEGGFEAGFTGSPPEDLPKPLPARARDVAGAYDTWQGCGFVSKGGEPAK